MERNLDFNLVEMGSHGRDVSMDSISKGSPCCFVENKFENDFYVEFFFRPEV